MLNFAYHNPVRLVFGRGAENEAGRLAETVARTHKCLVVYGGGSVVLGEEEPRGRRHDGD